MTCPDTSDLIEHNGRSSRLGIVMPLANEAACIDRLLERVLSHLGKDDRVFCVLDQISKDGTREIIERLARTEQRIVLVWAPENRCVVDAYFRGYREALRAGVDWILEMDGGFSHDPEQIPVFIRAMENGAEYVAGSRFMDGGRYSGPWKRYLVSRGGTMLANLLLGTRMYDMTSGYECFSRRALQHVLDVGVESRAHFFQTEIRYYMHEFNWVEVPITYTNPSKGLGSSSIKEALRNLWRLRKAGREKRRELQHQTAH